MSTPFYRGHPQMTHVLRRVKRPSAELAEQLGKACRARSNVTLSGAFNAPCQPAELGMIALFAILSVHNDYFATVVTPLSYKRRPMATVEGVGWLAILSSWVGELRSTPTYTCVATHDFAGQVYYA